MRKYDFIETKKENQPEGYITTISVCLNSLNNEEKVTIEVDFFCNNNSTSHKININSDNSTQSFREINLEAFYIVFNHMREINYILQKSGNYDLNQI
jgi:hypothetical protein